MKTEYRIIFTATFNTATERDKAYDSLKEQVNTTIKNNALFIRADMVKDEYNITEKTSERVI